VAGAPDTELASHEPTPGLAFTCVAPAGSTILLSTRAAATRAAALLAAAVRSVPALAIRDAGARSDENDGGYEQSQP
jgi:hypothetical protein